jgi:DNA invertase Pin-like site-specific DNA recombinase
MTEKFVALYSRVSTSYQDNGLEAQERALEHFCSNNNISHYKKFSDKNVSGAKSSRPQLDKLMEDIKIGNISKVIVYSFSRFARSTRHLLDALEFFNKYNVEFISLSEKFEINSPMGKAFFTVIAAISTLERELIVERVTTGLKNAQAKGKIIGRPKIRPSETILNLRKKNHSYREIAQIIGMSHTAVAREIKKSERNQSNSS